MTEIEHKHRKSKGSLEVEKQHEGEYLSLAHINDMRGHKCRLQPAPDEIPHLESGRKSKGCDYKVFPPPENHPGSIDIPSLYKHAKATAAYFEVRTREPGQHKDSLSSGSGAIVGKRNGNELLILTANHVVGGDKKGTKTKEVEVRLDDRDVEKGRVVDRLPKEDLALVAIQIDPAKMSTYEVATAIKSLKELRHGDKVLGVGFPRESESPYASPGTIDSIERERNLGQCTPKNCYGEDWNRQMINVRMHTKEGDSGLGVRLANGKLIGNLNGSNEGDIVFSALNPVTQSKIDSMIREAKPFKSR